MSFTTSWWDMEATNEPFTWAERETESVMLLVNRNKKHRFPHSVKLESSTNLYDSVPFLDTSLHCCSTWRASIQTYIQTHAKDKGRFNSHIVSTAVIRHQPEHVGQTAFEQAFFTVMTRRNPQWHASFTQSHTNTVLPSIKNSITFTLISESESTSWFQGYFAVLGAELLPPLSPKWCYNNRTTDCCWHISKWDGVICCIAFI